MPNSEESRPNKKRKMEESPSSSLISSLPDDVALNYVTLLWRWDHAALSLTSKSYRSLVASHDLYKIRSLMGGTEPYIYVCFRIPPVDRWYILRRRKTLDADLIPIPSIPSQPREASLVVVLDSEIYIIGGLIKGIPSCDVWLLEWLVLTRLLAL
ncbi:F-box/kelch-repeat protein SKIP6 [Cardamine amara subsp. amara]|uniref:F-box/kelch-repeat protein SKIP6 n=1 Tax=Cardamine amara subsp. amara TaxID=228776 RepID=A0ABD1BGU0_CARAN